MPSTSNKKASTKGKKEAPSKHAAPKKAPAPPPKKKAAPEAQARKHAPSKTSAGGKAPITSKSTAKTTVVVKAPPAKVSAKAAPAAKSAAPKSVVAKPAPGKSAPAKQPPGKPGKSEVASAPAAKNANGKGAPAATKDLRGASSTPASSAGAGKSVAPAAVVATDDKKVPAKGITVVQHKPMRKPKIKVKVTMPSDPLFKPGSKWKPLIPSGPNATPTGMANIHSHGHSNDVKPVFKSKLTKKELEPYRKILLSKRSELVGDIAHMEDEALRQSSGSLSQLPQHMAEQGSDTFEQSLSLDLAAVDRSLIREIDDALKRIEDGTYGMCERTGKPINAVRLAELPWARYSIEAARELERRPYQE
jgi:RNA polymerase-binding transcription factor DksA